MASLFDYCSPLNWSVNDNPQLKLFEILDGNGERIAVFKKKTDAYIASGALSMLSRLMYIKDFQRSVLGQIDECLKQCCADMHLTYTGGNFNYDEADPDTKELHGMEHELMPSDNDDDDDDDASKSGVTQE